MNLWHRAIAILLLMVFTPTAVLAATPLRYCISDDGHRALEFVVSVDHHQTAETFETEKAFGENVFKGDTNCVDRQLLGSNRLARVTSQDLKFSISDIPPILTPAVSSPAEPLSTNYAVDGYFVVPANTDPGIRVRETTVLLV